MDKKKEIEGILNSLDGMEKASPGAFFFTRVKARLQKRETGLWGKLAYFIAKPSVALAMLAVIFLLNAGVLFYRHTSISNTSIADQNETVFAEEYNTTLAANSYYDENTDAR